MNELFTNLRVPDGDGQRLISAAEPALFLTSDNDAGWTATADELLTRLLKAIFSFVLGNRIIHLYKY